MRRNVRGPEHRKRRVSGRIRGISGVGTQILPDHVSFRGHLEETAFRACTDERVAVDQPLGTGDEVSEKGLSWPRRVLPDRLLGCEATTRVEAVAPVDLDRRLDFDHRGEVFTGSTVTIVEHQEVTGTGMIRWDPARVVLGEELPILFRTAAIHLRITPAVEQIATPSAGAADTALGSLRARTMVQDPDLTVLIDAQEDLIEGRIVGNGVGVHEVGGRVRCSNVSGDVAECPEALEESSGDVLRTTAGVDVEELRMPAHLAVVGPPGVVVLYQVIPEVPFPDHASGIGRVGRSLDGHGGELPSRRTCPHSRAVACNQGSIWTTRRLYGPGWRARSAVSPARAGARPPDGRPVRPSPAVAALRRSAGAAPPAPGSASR